MPQTIKIVKPTRPRLGTPEHWVDSVLTEIYSYLDPDLFTVKDLSDMAGVSQATIYRLLHRESPNVRAITLWRLGKPLGLNLKTFKEKGESAYHRHTKGKRKKAKVA
jgi:transcriptional regulator with XRE-family HTH domain